MRRRRLNTPSTTWTSCSMWKNCPILENQWRCSPKTFNFRMFRSLMIKKAVSRCSPISIWKSLRESLRRSSARPVEASPPSPAWLPVFGMWTMERSPLAVWTFAVCRWPSLPILSALLHRITSCLTAPSRKISGWETLMLRTKKYMRQQKPPAVMNLYRNWTMAMTRWPGMRGTGFQAAKNSAFPLPAWFWKMPLSWFWMKQPRSPIRRTKKKSSSLSLLWQKGKLCLSSPIVCPPSKMPIRLLSCKMGRLRIRALISSF